jgi:hypothetical protein
VIVCALSAMCDAECDGVCCVGDVLCVRDDDDDDDDATISDDRP